MLIFVEVGGSDLSWFQSPRGDFGFLKEENEEEDEEEDEEGFNPLAGILVF